MHFLSEYMERTENRQNTERSECVYRIQKPTMSESRFAEINLKFLFKDNSPVISFYFQQLIFKKINVEIKL